MSISKSTGDVYSVAHSIQCHYLNCYFSLTIYSPARARRINGNFTCQIWHKKGQATSLTEQCFQYDFFSFFHPVPNSRTIQIKKSKQNYLLLLKFTCLNKQMIHTESQQEYLPHKLVYFLYCQLIPSWYAILNKKQTPPQWGKILKVWCGVDI